MYGQGRKTGVSGFADVCDADVCDTGMRGLTSAFETATDPPMGTDTPSARHPASEPVTLGLLAGVRPGDSTGEERRRARGRPRMLIRPIHMMAAMLLLVAALCASLTLLVQQSLHYQAALSAASGETPSRAETDAEDPDDGESGSTGVTDKNITADDAAGDADDPVDIGGDAPSSSLDSADGGSSTGTVDDGLIDLNTATSEQLQTINGIGPVTAQSILDYRRQLGRFDSVDQLLGVKGIGSKTLEKIRPQVTIR